LYVFNQLLELFWSSPPLSEKTEILMAGFSLDHGDSESGTSYFEAQNEARLRGAIESAPDARSFRDLHTAITAPELREAIGMSRRRRRQQQEEREVNDERRPAFRQIPELERPGGRHQDLAERGRTRALLPGLHRRDEQTPAD
jgi:hypothetical protein